MKLFQNNGPTGAAASEMTCFISAEWCKVTTNATDYWHNLFPKSMAFYCLMWVFRSQNESRFPVSICWKVFYSAAFRCLRVRVQSFQPLFTMLLFGSLLNDTSRCPVTSTFRVTISDWYTIFKSRLVKILLLWCAAVSITHDSPVVKHVRE